MAMTEEAFARRVFQLEMRAGKSPGSYKLKVTAIIAFGYATLFGLVLASFGIAAALAYFAYRSGVEVNEVRRALKVAPLHDILLNSDFNASVVEQPRLLGLLGSRRYLILGLPLLALVGKEEFRAIIGHEFGHLSGRHGRFGSWVYRIRGSWAILQKEADRARRSPIRLLRGFFDWYGPIVQSHTFVLARQHEYEADRCASDLSGVEETARALVMTSVYGDVYSSLYWKRVFDSVERLPEPTLRPYADARKEFHALLTADVARDCLRRELEQPAGLDDPHPSLADRLKALGTSTPEPPSWPENSAADLLGAEARPVFEEFDRSWRGSIMAQWRERHVEVAKGREQLAEYRKVGPDDLNEAELQDFAALAQEFESAEKAAPLYAALLERAPENAAANYNIGAARLHRKDESAIALIEKAMDNDHQAVQPGCQLLYGYLKDIGRDAEAEAYAARWNQQRELYDKAEEERTCFAPDDRYKPASLSEQELQAVREALRKFPWISRAFLVKKVVRYFPESPIHVLGITTEWYKRRHKNAAQEIRNAIHIRPELVVINLNKSIKLRWEMERVDGSQLTWQGDGMESAGG